MIVKWAQEDVETLDNLLNNNNNNNNTYSQRIRRRSNLGHIFRGKKCILWARKYGKCLAFVGLGINCTRCTVRTLI